MYTTHNIIIHAQYQPNNKLNLIHKFDYFLIHKITYKIQKIS